MKQIIIDNISTSYFITENGECYNSKTNKYLKGSINKVTGYKGYKLTLPTGKQKMMYAHRLVAFAYIKNEDREKNQVNHKDGNKLNNCVENLEWVTNRENTIHALENDLKHYQHLYCFNRDKKLIAEYKTVAEASRAVNISAVTLNNAAKKEEKFLVGNFYWSFEKKLGKTKIYPKTGRKKPVNQYDLKGKFITSYESLGIAAKAIGLSNCNRIGECCRGKRESYKGFIWRFSEDIVSPSGESQR